jgi:hypothetical protein
MLVGRVNGVGPRYFRTGDELQGDSCWDALARIMRGNNPDAWVAIKDGDDNDQEFCLSKFAELLEDELKPGWLTHFTTGVAVVRTLPY